MKSPNRSHLAEYKSGSIAMLNPKIRRWTVMLREGHPSWGDQPSIYQFPRIKERPMRCCCPAMQSPVNRGWSGVRSGVRISSWRATLGRVRLRTVDVDWTAILLAGDETGDRVFSYLSFSA